MKKLLVVLLILAMAFGAFAQININGSLRTKVSYSSNGGGWYDLAKGFGIDNDGSRVVLSGNWEGTAGANLEMRLADVVGADSKKTPTTVMKLQNFWGWAKPVDWFKVSLGWIDIGDYLIKDTTGTIAFDGNMRNTSKLDYLGGNVKFGGLAQFYALDGNLNIGVALASAGAAKVTDSANMVATLAVAYNIPNIGKAVLEGQAQTTQKDTGNNFRGSLTFQYNAMKAFDVALGIKYTGKALDPSNYMGRTNSNDGKLFADNNFSVMVLAGIRPVEKLAINLGVEVFFNNGAALADTVSVSYDFGFIKPILYTYGWTVFDSSKVNGFTTRFTPKTAPTEKLVGQHLIGLELNIPVTVGKAGVLAAGIAYDMSAEAFQVPVFFRVFF